MERIDKTLTWTCVGLVATLLGCSGCTSREKDCVAFSSALNGAYQGNVNSAAEAKARTDARRSALAGVVSEDEKLRSLYGQLLEFDVPSVDTYRTYEAARARFGDNGNPDYIQALEARNRRLAESGAQGMQKLGEIQAYCAE